MGLIRRAMFICLVTAMAGSLAFQVNAAEPGAEGDVKVLLLTGFDVKAHNWEETARVVHTILAKSGRFDVTISSDKEVLSSPSLPDYQALVFCYGFWDEPDPSEAAKAGLLNYAKNGGGVVALHFACSSFQEWDEYQTLLGRVWKKGVGGHGPYGQFEVAIKNSNHPISAGLEDFKTEDELYARLTGDESIDVLASAYSDWSQKVEPLVFVKSYGKGRVVHNLLGHGFDSKQNPSFQALLRRGVEWAATGEVTIE